MLIFNPKDAIRRRLSAAVAEFVECLGLGANPEAQAWEVFYENVSILRAFKCADVGIIDAILVDATGAIRCANSGRSS